MKRQQPLGTYQNYHSPVRPTRRLLATWHRANGRGYKIEPYRVELCTCHNELSRHTKCVLAVPVDKGPGIGTGHDCFGRGCHSTPREHHFELVHDSRSIVSGNVVCFHVALVLRVYRR